MINKRSINYLFINLKIDTTARKAEKMQRNELPSPYIKHFRLARWLPCIALVPFYYGHAKYPAKVKLHAVYDRHIAAHHFIFNYIILCWLNPPPRVHMCAWASTNIDNVRCLRNTFFPIIIFNLPSTHPGAVPPFLFNIAIGGDQDTILTSVRTTDSMPFTFIQLILFYLSSIASCFDFI